MKKLIPGLLLFLFFQSCFKRKCPEYPTHNLCEDQLEWFRPEGEVWTFVTDKGDTVRTKATAPSKVLGFSKVPGYNRYSKCLSGPKVENGFQQMPFFEFKTYSLQIINLNMTRRDPDFSCEEPYFEVNGWSTQSFKKELLQDYVIGGIKYSNVIKSFNDRPELPTMDTVYYNKEKGILKMHFVTEKLILERIN